MIPTEEMDREINEVREYIEKYEYLVAEGKYAIKLLLIKKEERIKLGITY